MAIFRSDGWVKSVLGQAIAGAQIFVCTQPADVTFVPPEPLAMIYSDPAGLVPITQPVMTDGFGHYDFYVAFGTYTVVVVTGGKIQQVYPDQTIGFTGTGGGSVSSVFGRTGDVVAQSGDYNVSQITGAAPSASPSFTGTVQIVNAVITGTLKDGSGSVGTSGQILSSTGIGTAWITGGGGGSGTVAPGTKGQVGLYASNGSTISGFSNSVYYPETYGAVGNGVTDDTASLQATIAAAISAGGGTVQFGAKTYLITSGLTLTLGYNVNLIGINAGSSTILCSSASADILTITGNNSGGIFSNNVIKDLEIKRSAQPTGTAKGISWSNVLWANVVRVNVWDSVYNFYQTECANINYDDCLSDNALGGSYTQTGWYYDGTSGNNSSRNVDCLAANDSNVSTVNGLVISGANIADLYCERFETAKCTYGVSITATTHGGNSPGINGNLHFTDCIHDQIATSAYLFTNVYDRMSYVEITGGYVEMKSGNNNPAIDIENSSGVVITGVDILCGGGSTGTNPGVYVHGSHSINNVINGNIFRVEDACTPVVLDTCSNNVVSNNTIYGYSGNPFSIGISLLSATSNSIIGNNLSGFGTTGINLDSGSSKNGGQNIVDTTNITTALSDSGTGNFVTVSSVGGTVTNSGSLTSNAVILGAGTTVVKAGAVLPGNAALYYDGTGSFSTPGGGGGATATSLFSKTVYTVTQRAIGTVYQNLTGQPIIVAGFLNMGSTVATAVCDSNPSPTTVVNEQITGSGLNSDFLFVVPNNDYYEISGSGVTFGNWTEWIIKAGSVTFSGELSGSRALSTVYQNTSGKAMLVCVDVSGVGSGTAITGISDSSATPSSVVWQSQGEVSGNQTMWMVVPNNDYYEITCSGAAVAHWNEYTMPFGAVKSVDYAAAPAQRVPVYNSNLDNRGNNTQPIWGTVNDKWLAFSDGNSAGAATIIGCAYSSTDPSLTQGVQCVSNNTVGNRLGAVMMLMQSGEFYQIGRDGSGVLAHWWEYTLG